MNIKSDKGVTMIDISISIMIIFLFSSLITGLVYNYAMSIKTVNRRAEATYQAVNIIETLKTIDYYTLNNELLSKHEEIEEITKNGNLYSLGINEINSILGTNKITMLDGYLAKIQFEKYCDREGNSEKKDLITIATVTVKYKVGKQEKDIELRTLLVKETL